MTTVMKPSPVVCAFDYLAHELANLLPMIEGGEFEALKRDIAKQGILEPIKLFEGRILDGRNRYKAAKEAGHKFVAANFKEFTGTYAEAEAYVLSANLHRRQMTNAQKQEFIRQMIGKYPAWSNRQIARLCQLSHATVAAVREKVTRPPELLEFEKFKKVWEEKLSDDYRMAFVKEFAVDLKEMLA